jgi:hypothetical protein
MIPLRSPRLVLCSVTGIGLLSIVAQAQGSCATTDPERISRLDPNYARNGSIQPRDGPVVIEVPGCKPVVCTAGDGFNRQGARIGSPGARHCKFK